MNQFLSHNRQHLGMVTKKLCNLLTKGKDFPRECGKGRSHSEKTALSELMMRDYRCNKIRICFYKKNFVGTKNSRQRKPNNW